MKREEALDIKVLTFDFKNSPVMEFQTEEMKLIVNKIYDSFESKGCDTCSKKPKEGENFSDECGVCMYFYSDNWESKDV